MGNFFDFSIEGKIIVKGPNRLEFLNGIVSNDVNKNGVYAAFLNRFGKILSDCKIYQFSDFILVNCSLVGKNKILEKLKEDAKLSKCIIEDVTMKFGLFSLDKNTLDNIQLNHLEKINENKIKINGEIEIMVVENKRTLENQYDLYVSVSNYNTFKKNLLDNAKQLTNTDYEAGRTAAKKPLFGIDFDSANIPNEVTETMISFEKGCYVGQEIVARVHNLGKPSKKLFYFDGSAKKGDKIFYEGKEAGHVTSSTGKAGFCFLKKEFLDQKNLTINNSEIKVRVV